jgi:hypothetical protein
LCGLLLFTSRVVAQARGTIDGIVTDSSLAPVNGATVWLLGSSLELTTRENGRFRMLGLPAGEYLVVVRHIGFAPLSTIVRLAGNDTARTSIILERASVSLDTIRVTAESPSPRLREFDQRRSMGLGQFMTASEIRRLNFPGTSDLLRAFRSVTIAGADGFAVNARDAPVRTCPFQFFIDGVPIPTPRNLNNELPPPGEIAGIEVHATVGMIPLQYATSGVDATFRGGGAMCGVILIWTK